MLIACLVSPPTIMGHYKRLMHEHIHDDRYIWKIEVLLVSPNWTSQIRYEAVAPLLRTPVVRAVLVCLSSIAA